MSNKYLQVISILHCPAVLIVKKMLKIDRCKDNRGRCGLMQKKTPLFSEDGVEGAAVQSKEKIILEGRDKNGQGWTPMDTEADSRTDRFSLEILL